MLDGDHTMADVTFIVEGRRVRLHRAILAARSEYFRRMLTNGITPPPPALPYNPATHQPYVHVCVCITYLHQAWQSRGHRL